MRLIDADALYERLKADEELARDRVIDTPSSFPNGAVNPFAIRYMAQLNERTRFKEMVFDAPTIEERQTGRWIPQDHNYTHGNISTCMYFSPVCSECGHTGDFNMNFCPNCGRKMEVGHDG